MSGRMMNRWPVSLYDTTWKPGIVTLPSGKPLTYSDGKYGSSLYADKRKKAQGNSAQSGQVSRTATPTATAAAGTIFATHEGKSK